VELDMMEMALKVVVLCFYGVATVGLLLYGLNCYVMLTLFMRRRREVQAHHDDRIAADDVLAMGDSLPVVTTQIAIYNELNVSERVMRAACNMRYPKGRHEIQVLDDSTDETQQLVERVAAELLAEGHDIKVLHRTDRTGFKAGALQKGLEACRGDVIAVFDADFVPQENYLLDTAHHFTSDSTLGFVQTRWGHLNRRASLLTRAQAVGIDGHFIIEQIARCWNGLFMNFNGTAGIWRKSAIVEGGGWQWETLTEDLDLSYRVQFAGWKTLYLPNVVVPAELPEDINAFRSQQFRWAKGSVQTLIKLFSRLMAADVSPFKKIQAIFHMGGYLVHPMMLTLVILALPVLHMMPEFRSASVFFCVLSLPLCFSVVAPSTLYMVSQRAIHANWKRRIFLLPFLMVVGIGMALSNTRAIIEAIFGKESEFVRTPKRGDRVVKQYAIRLPWVSVAEIGLGLYSCWTLVQYLLAGKLIVSPFLAIYAAGFLFIGMLTFCETFIPARK
jgi:cellulose synthase/poly-beta-1,6-N-acetylglucosamine synthase-like glycosyltransferase